MKEANETMGEMLRSGYKTRIAIGWYRLGRGGGGGGGGAGSYDVSTPVPAHQCLAKLHVDGSLTPESIAKPGERCVSLFYCGGMPRTARVSGLEVDPAARKVLII